MTRANALDLSGEWTGIYNYPVALPPVAFEAVQRARLLSSGAGVASAFERIDPPEFFLFEPHQPELCKFEPNTFVNITPVFDSKVEAMAAMGAQSYLKDYRALKMSDVDDGAMVFSNPSHVLEPA